MKKVIAIDVDGTLCKETCWTPHECLKAKPILQNINKVNNWYNSNFIVIHTARRGYLYEATVEWLKTNGVMFHSVTMDKMPADCYYDDKALNPEYGPTEYEDMLSDM